MVFPYEAVHIPFPGSILKNICYYLAQETEKGQGWGNNGKEEPREFKSKAPHTP